MSALVVASDQVDRVSINALQRPQIEDDFDAEIPPVDVVAEKEIASLVRRAAHFEQLEVISTIRPT